jgi:hypothetical protein
LILVHLKPNQTLRVILQLPALCKVKTGLLRLLQVLKENLVMEVMV